MSIATTLAHLIDEFRRARERARTERMIGSLPAEIRKDIGWPGRAGEGETRNGAAGRR